jgi:hypothetical protein
MKLQQVLEGIEDQHTLIRAANSLYAKLKPMATSEFQPSEAQMLGPIGKFVNTGNKQIDAIDVVLYGAEEMQAFARQEYSEENAERYMGFWDPEYKMLVLNRDRLGESRMRTIITHELRHALDDILSGYRATSSDRYTQAPDASNSDRDYQYLASPMELNARFSEVLHLMTGVMRKALRENPANARDVAIKRFGEAMRARQIEQLFPEKTKSRTYRQLVKRGMLFIDSFLEKQGL